MVRLGVAVLGAVSGCEARVNSVRASCLRSTLRARRASLGLAMTRTRHVRKLVLITGIVLSAALLGVAVVAFRSRIAREARWQSLEGEISKLPLTVTADWESQAPVSARLTPEGDQVGHVKLGNGEIWCFAFRSHHRIEGEESYSVFIGPGGSYRVRGSHFCCGVEMADEGMPKDGAEFVAFLHKMHPVVEKLKDG